MARPKDWRNDKNALLKSVVIPKKCIYRSPVINILFYSLFAISALTAQSSLYQSASFSISDSSVRQGEHLARAVSDSEISSTYAFEHSMGINPLIAFKFSINGLDNERPPFRDHHLLLSGEQSEVVSPLYVFGKKHFSEQEGNESYVSLPASVGSVAVLFRVDMRPVLQSFALNDYFRTHDGKKIYREEFKGVYMAGGNYPLKWIFGPEPERSQFELTDEDGDSVYTVKVTFALINNWQAGNGNRAVWRLQKDISRFPAYHSDLVLVDALYNLSLEELILDIRDDSSFMAGAKWPGVWTRDIGYSIILSLAILAPDESRRSLMAKVINGHIIQDTGTGGSWPISSDRVIWALAARELYLITGNEEWWAQARNIILNSVSADTATLIDTKTGLLRGESSFLDWREQSYPRWMEPKDIYQSLNLGTNALHYQTYRILSEFDDKYKLLAGKIKFGINTHLWAENRRFYGQYLYGEGGAFLSNRSESLGEALTILYDIADENRAHQMLKSLPVLEFGIPIIYPQIPGINPYHNNSIWPFVSAYAAWAGAKEKNSNFVELNLASIYRAAALFLTNKENMVAGTGDFNGTEINSDRQLWSVAGNLSTLFRVFYGMHFYPGHMDLRPFIPKAYGGKKELTNFRYGRGRYTIRIEGFGDKVATTLLDEKAIPLPRIPFDLSGDHEIILKMNGSIPPSSINLVKNRYAPHTPAVMFWVDSLKWQKTGPRDNYRVYKDGLLLKETEETTISLKEQRSTSGEYRVQATDIFGNSSFLSKPLRSYRAKDLKYLDFGKVSGKEPKPFKNASGYGALELSKSENRIVEIRTNVKQAGWYNIDILYANGEGPINTDNRVAIRTLYVDGLKKGVFIFPQRGVGQWDNWGYSNNIRIFLAAGERIFSLRFVDFNENMNGEINRAYVDYVRLILSPGYKISE